MIGAENIDHQIIAAFELGHVVCDIRKAVRRFSGGFYYDAIRFIAKLGKFQPCCPFLFITQIVFLEMVEK
jgi:hypothetical protein